MPGVATTSIRSAGLLGIDPLGLAISGESITGLRSGLEQSGFRSSGAGAGFAAVAPDQEPSLFCPQLAFQPLVNGCQALLNPGTSGGLANTGTPILIALVGWFLIGTGSLVYRRSRVAGAHKSSPRRGLNGRS